MKFHEHAGVRVSNTPMSDRGYPKDSRLGEGRRWGWLRLPHNSADRRRSECGFGTSLGLPVPFTRRIGGSKALDKVATDPNFAMIYSGDGGRRGIATKSDLAIHVTAGLGKDLRQAESSIVPETESTISTRSDALSAGTHRGWRLPGAAIGWR